MKRILGLLLTAVLGGLFSLYIFTRIQNKNNDVQYINTSGTEMPVAFSSNANTPAHSAPVIQNLPSFTEAAEKSVHAVVHIRTEYERKSEYYDDFFDMDDILRYFYYGPKHKMPLMATGSGVIISEDGYIVTNNHVVDGASKIEVILNDKRTYEAELIGKDPTTDLALVKIGESALPFLSYGDSDNVKLGEWVLAVGNPFNLTSTVTAGIVSAKARNINILGKDVGSAIESFIQTDAVVNRGNSGGALVNTTGDLVGINAAIASNTGSYTGYSFAIPVNIVKRVVSDLIQYGVIQRAFLGVTISDLNSQIVEYYNLDVDDLEGVYINGVTEDGAANESGLREGDIIMEVNEHKVNSTSELMGYVGQYRPGDHVTLTVKRNKRINDYDLVLRNKYGNVEIVKGIEKEINSILGATFEEVSDEDLDRLNLNYGVRISHITNGPLKRSGVKEGFVVTQIEDQPVKSVSDITGILNNASGGILLEGYYPNGTKAYYGFGI